MQVEGTIGDVTFYKSKDGFRIRSRGGVSRERILNSPAYERTRENLSEFGRAAKAGKTLRLAFATPLKMITDGRMVSRLSREMYRVIQSDANSTRGQRNVLDGETELLKGFEFNEGSNLATTLTAPFTAAINRESGKASINIPAFIPATAIKAPVSSTHFRLALGAAEINFEAGAYTAGQAFSGILPIGMTATTPITLEHNLPADSTHPLFLAFGIQFFLETNGDYYPLNDSSHNALSLVQVDGGA